MSTTPKKPSFQTFVWVSGGYFVVKQIDGSGEEAVVRLLPEQARTMVTALNHRLETPLMWDEGAPYGS